MLDFHRVARLLTVARSLAMGGAIAFCSLTLEHSSAQQPLSQPPTPTRGQALAPLIAQLQQPAARIRAAAATKLASYGQRAAEATSPLIARLSDSDSDVRLAAAYALGCVQQDSERVVAELVPLLVDQDEHVRYSAGWSIARIARGLQDQTDAARHRSLISAFETAIRHLKTHEHQARHLVAMELALARLRQSIEAETSPAPELEKTSEALAHAPTPSPAVTVGDPLDLASRVYAASDLLGRLQFVERLSDVENDSDDMRRVVIRFEGRQPDAVVLRYAVARWGARGQQLIAEQFDTLIGKSTAADESALDSLDASIIELLEPTSAQQVASLLDMASHRAHQLEVRVAALNAIAAARAIGPDDVERLLDVLADASDELEVRTATAQALAELEAAAAQAEPRLVAILNREPDSWLRYEVASALARTSMASPAAAHAMHAALLATPTDSAHYCDMVDCCGAYGSLAAECLPQLIAGLSHDDAQVRQCCANTLCQIGPAASEAIDTLVDRVFKADELISVKNSAAKALCAIGPAGLKRLVDGLAHCEPEFREPGLRALAIAGPAGEFACDECLAVLNDSQASSAVRSAAATALGAMGSASARAVPQLLELSMADQADTLRAASLIAALQIDPHCGRSHMKHASREKGLLLRASAASAYRLAGEAQTGFEMLVGMLDGSDTDEVIERALAEFGPAAQPWLVKVAGDVDASPAKRLVCFRLACAMPSPAWSELLPLVDDEELGDEMALSIGGQVSEDTRAVATLLARLRENELVPAAHARMVRLLTPDGLGAAGDEEDWHGELALIQPSAANSLAAADRSGAPGAAGDPQAVEALPSASEPLGGSPSGGASNPAGGSAPPREPGQSFRPTATARATGGDMRLAASSVATQVVQVFYGTNRARLASEAPQQELATSVLATAAGGLLAMLVCLIGFVRSGHRPFAIVALLAIGIVAPFGFQAAQNYSHSVEHATTAYGGDYCAEIDLGMCEVSIPPGHRPGALESPNLFKLEVQPDVDKHVVLTSVQQLSKDRFFEQLHSRMAADGKNILVFIHGYNVSFEDAARRTAQMAADLKFPGAPVFYSWPSQANWYGYAADKENIELSVTQIKSFLLELSKQSGATTINLVAHSMGNVGLTQALKEMEGLSPQPMFNQVVLAAPDIDADIFKNRVAPYIITKAQHVTLYTSQTDLALIASRYFNSGPRVGDSGAGVPLFPGIDTIDATAVDSSLLGHSYYGSNVSVLTDLGRVLENQPIASRQYLRAIAEAAQPYWAFDPLRISQTPGSGSQR